MAWSGSCKCNAVAPTQKSDTSSCHEKLDCGIRVGRGVSLRMANMLTLVLILLLLSGSVEMGMGFGQDQEEEGEPTPKVWPEQFHAVLIFNNTKTSELQLIDLWYDWPNGRNLNLIQHQLGKRLYDVEYTNGTSYYFTLTKNGDKEECRTILFDVGILRPNWLDGASYMGQHQVDGFLCNVWYKADFIWYYEDVVSKRPVHWLFYTGRAAHVMTFEVGAVLEDSQWQAPAYCFDKHKQQIHKSVIDDTHLGAGLPLLRSDPVGFA